MRSPGSLNQCILHNGGELPVVCIYCIVTRIYLLFAEGQYMPGMLKLLLSVKCVCMCVCACVRACVRACMRVPILKAINLLYVPCCLIGLLPYCDTIL